MHAVPAIHMQKILYTWHISGLPQHWNFLCLWDLLQRKICSTCHINLTLILSTPVFIFTISIFRPVIHWKYKTRTFNDYHNHNIHNHNNINNALLQQIKVIILYDTKRRNVIPIYGLWNGYYNVYCNVNKSPNEFILKVSIGKLENTWVK